VLHTILSACRDFINSSYAGLVKANKGLPLLVRECSGVEPTVTARFGKTHDLPFLHLFLPYARKLHLVFPFVMRCLSLYDLNRPLPSCQLVGCAPKMVPRELGFSNLVVCSGSTYNADTKVVTVSLAFAFVNSQRTAVRRRCPWLDLVLRRYVAPTKLVALLFVSDEWVFMPGIGEITATSPSFL
jgi:hypothetical protein